jgi:prenyltransferase/squalene oxidase-like repeat protein
MTSQEHKSGKRLEGKPEIYAESSALNMALPSMPEPKPRSNSEAVAAGLGFVMESWSDDRWTDFNLPSGESDVWTTAYVLARLGEIPSEYFTFNMRDRIRASLDWLLRTRNSDGGWGQSSELPSDADSTSWAILALRRHGVSAPDDAFDVIFHCRRPDGGVALYPEETALGKNLKLGSPDVTAVSINALGTMDTAAQEFLSSCWLQTNKPLPSSRLVARFYTCSAILDWDVEKVPWSLLNKLCELMSFYNVENAFEQALLLRCLSQLRIQKAWSIAAALRRMQQADGSWLGSAFLRPPGVRPSGNSNGIYFDQRRIVTTVTAISALTAGETQPGLYFGSDRPLPQRLKP